MINAAELADLIAEDTRAMPDTATILRTTAVRTPTGGYTQDFLPVGTTPCRLTASILSGGNERSAVGELVPTMGYTLTVPPGTDIKARDRVQVSGTTFEVNAIKGAASWNLSDSATLTEIQS